MSSGSTTWYQSPPSMKQVSITNSCETSASAIWKRPLKCSAASSAGNAEDQRRGRFRRRGFGAHHLPILWDTESHFGRKDCHWRRQRRWHNCYSYGVTPWWYFIVQKDKHWLQRNHNLWTYQNVIPVLPFQMAQSPYPTTNSSTPTLSSHMESSFHLQTTVRPWYDKHSTTKAKARIRMR